MTPPDTIKEIKWRGRKIYCKKHEFNRDITCEICNFCFTYNCKSDAEFSKALDEQRGDMIKIVERISAIFDIKTQDYLVEKRKIIKKIKKL